MSLLAPIIRPIDGFGEAINFHLNADNIGEHSAQQSVIRPAAHQADM